MKKRIFNVLFAVLLGVSFSLTAVPAIASSATLTINENPSPVFPLPPGLIPDQAYVIKDNVNYKLYYAGNDFASINLAQSLDGITWTPYSGNPIISDGQYHADVKYYSSGFTGANSGTNPSSLTMYYRMWYAGLNQNSISGWRYAESPDGINWYNHISVAQFGPPVYSAATGVTYGIADVIYTPGATNTGTDWTFRIYANVQWEIGIYGGKELVVMAFSSDGYNWTGYDPTSVGYATPVFAGTLVTSDFDCDHIGWFKVIKNSPTDWEAFYSGGKDTTYKALNGIGYATSTDGINWTRNQTLFTTSDGVAWRSQSVWMPSVVKTGSNYQIWFLGSNNPDLDNSDWIQWKLGAANLTVAPTMTPCDWVEYSNNPVIGQWLGNAKAYYPKVIYDSNQFSGHGDTAYYKMWFGSSGGIGYAYSNDGINWTAGQNPVSGLISGANHPLVKYRADGFGTGIYYKIWYEDPTYTYTIDALRYAESIDGINWTNDQALTQDNTYKLITGTWPDWNYGSYGPCDLIYNPSGSNSLDDDNLWNNKYVLYYMGTTGSNEFIGLAYSNNGTHWKRYSSNPVLSPCDLVCDSPAACWDYCGVGYCSVINLSANNWQMWYGGGPNTNHGIGYATSPDGINWTKHPDNPIFHMIDGINWRNARTYTPWVIYDVADFSGNGDACPYKMWYSGMSADIKYSVGYACATPVDAGPDQQVCEGGSPITLTGASPAGGTWSGTGVSDSTFDPAGLLPGPYIVTYTWINPTKSCSSSDNKTVTVNARPTASASTNSPVCIGQTIQLTGGPDGMSSYLWIGPNGFSNSEQSPSIPNATSAMAGNYVLTVTDANGCSDNTTAPVSVIQCGGGGAPAGIAGGLPASFVSCPMTLVADMQGNITTASMTNDGVLCKTCLAQDAAHQDTLELDKDAKVMLADNKIPALLIFRKAAVMPPAPENCVIVGPAYEINAYSATVATTPSPISISPAAKLLLTYDPGELPDNASEVFIATYDSDKGWLPLDMVPGVVAEIGKAQGLVNHFTIFAVVAKLTPPAPAKLEVSNLTVSPTRVELNQEVTISLDVSNTGGTNGEYELELKVDGTVISKKQVNLEAGSRQTVNFTTTAGSTGEHRIELAGQTVDFEVISRSKPDIPLWWFMGGITCLVLLAFVLFLVFKR
jgi:CARDB